jgi:hypothetical protein
MHWSGGQILAFQVALDWRATRPPGAWQSMLMARCGSQNYFSCSVLM